MKIYTCLCLLFLAGYLVAQNNTSALLPMPNQITPVKGKPFTVRSGKTAIYLNQPELQFTAKTLQTILQDRMQAKVPLASESGRADIRLLVDPAMEGKEHYRIKITSKGITISGATAGAVYYGVMTMDQLLLGDACATAHKEISPIRIDDAPRFPHRALMLDPARHFLPVNDVKFFIDQMARYKYNILQLHLTDDQGWRIEIKKYPKLTEIGAWRDSSEIDHFGSNRYDGRRHGGFYTQEEIKEVVDYAAKRNITVIPEIEMPGHASAAIAAYPWLGTSGKQIKVPGKFGVQYDIFNVADPRVIHFLNDVMDEVISLFPAPIFHVGGDEVRYNQWKESALVREYMRKNDLRTPAELQVFFTNNVSNILASKGRRMMGWNEITGDKLHEFQSETDTKGKQKLAPGTIVHCWKGDPKLIKEAIEKGYDVVNSYHSYTYLDYTYEAIPLEKAYNFNPVPEGLTEKQKGKVLGLGCQMWGEFIPTVNSMNLKIYPRLAAYAEAGWTQSSNKDYNRFLNVLDAFLKKWKQEGIIIEENSAW